MTSKPGPEDGSATPPLLGPLDADAVAALDADPEPGAGEVQVRIAACGRASASAGKWAVLVVTLAALLLSARKLYALFAGRRPDSRTLGRGLDWILGAAGLDVFLGLTAFWLGLYGVAGRSAADPATSLRYLFEWLVEGTAVAILALASIYYGAPLLLDVAVILALLAFIGTIAFALGAGGWIGTLIN